MKGLKLFAPLFLALAACNPPGPQTLNVTLVDGIGEPLQPLAAAWRIGPPPSTSGLPWIALPTGQSSWSLPSLPIAASRWPSAAPM